MIFAYSPVLLLVFPFLVIFVVALFKRQPSLIVTDVQQFDSNKKNLRQINRTKLPLFFLFLACLGLIIALARPQEGLEIIKDERFVLDIILALDVSGSMESYDAEKGTSSNQVASQINSGKLKSRIEVAKQELLRFVDERSHDRLGLIVFAQKSFSSCPPTLEHDYLREKIKQLSTKILGNFSSATGIAAPIKSAVNKLKDSAVKRRVVILFTDGENTINDDITPEKAADIAQQYNIRIYTVGIGSSNSYSIQSSFFGGKKLVSSQSSINEDLLKKIATKTGGKYFAAKSQEEFKEVIEEINQLEKVAIESEVFTHQKEFYHYFILFSLFSLFISSFLQSTFCRRLP